MDENKSTWGDQIKKLPLFKYNESFVKDFDKKIMKSFDK